VLYTFRRGDRELKENKKTFLITARTGFTDEDGNGITWKDIRTGEVVKVVTNFDSNVAVWIQKGPIAISLPIF
jgi:hypothetical protein